MSVRDAPRNLSNDFHLLLFVYIFTRDGFCPLDRTPHLPFLSLCLSLRYNFIISLHCFYYFVWYPSQVSSNEWCLTVHIVCCIYHMRVNRKGKQRRRWRAWEWRFWFRWLIYGSRGYAMRYANGISVASLPFFFQAALAYFDHPNIFWLHILCWSLVFFLLCCVGRFWFLACVMSDRIRSVI